MSCSIYDKSRPHRKRIYMETGQGSSCPLMTSPEILSSFTTTSSALTQLNTESPAFTALLVIVLTLSTGRSCIITRFLIRNSSHSKFIQKVPSVFLHHYFINNIPPPHIPPPTLSFLSKSHPMSCFS